MAKITKELKNVTFIYDEETKGFTLMEADGLNGYIQLNKIYAFAFMRFVVRMAQRNWLRSNKPIQQTEEDHDLIEEENPNQLNLF